MARLIDADALPKAMEYDYETGEMKILYYDAWVIAHAPTVDAIPVEWLLNHIPHDEPMEAYNKILIEYLVIAWRKENESNIND